MKTLDIDAVKTAKDNIKDIKFFGDPHTFRLISKASSKEEDWMKSTKAMEIEGVGCVIQVTTQQGDNVAEALTFVPGVRIEEYPNGIRRIMPIPHPSGYPAGFVPIKDRIIG